METVKSAVPVRPEGWEEGREVLLRDPWPELYRAMEGRLRVDALVVGVEGKGDDRRLVLDLGGVRGYLPLAEAGDGLPPDPVQAVGTHLACRVVACDRAGGTCRLERKSLVEEMARETWEALLAACREVLQLRERERALSVDDPLARGEIRAVRLKVSQVAPLWPCAVRWVSRQRAVVDLGGVLGTMPRVEVAWTPPEHVGEVLKPGDCLRVKVIDLDTAAREALVSRRWVLPDPWEGADKKYRKGGVYAGKVARHVSDGRAVLVELEPGLAVLAQALPAGLPVGSEVLLEVREVDVATRRGFGRVVRVRSRS